MPTIWSVAIFAHNEAATLAEAVRSAQIAGEGATTEIVILANGCRDNTVQVARDLAQVYRNIHVIEIALADKANAWNHYVHEVSPQLPFSNALMHVFMDGDVKASAPSFGAFAAAFDLYADANAVGALPIGGRDRAAWCQRMTANGTLAGGLYALRGAFLQRIRQLGIYIPRGFIGEDWLVSLFAKTDLGPLSQSAQLVPKIVFARDAGFSFRSLSPLRPTDYRIYMKRLWRYSLRGVQYEMLINYLMHHHPAELPADVDKLYMSGLPPSRIKWIGLTSILRTAAVQKVRLLRSRRSQKEY